MKKILIPVPSTDFDPTECAVPWKVLTERGVRIYFATPQGKRARCDSRMITGDRLGFLTPFLVADKNGREAYAELEKNAEFSSPISWPQVDAANFDGLILPGGHAPGMKEYLESQLLQKVVADFFAVNKPVGAICHGVVLASRSKIEGVSVLKGRKTTSLLKSQELLAWRLTRLWLGNYYRTYNETVEDEVRANLESPEHFERGPAPISRDSLNHLHRGFVVRDGTYVSARWPGDAHRFAMEFLATLD